MTIKEKLLQELESAIESGLFRVKNGVTENQHDYDCDIEKYKVIFLSTKKFTFIPFFVK